MAKIVPPKASQVDAHSLSQWHTIFKTPWDILVGLDYIDGVTLALHASQVDSLAAASGEVCLDNTDQTRTEKELSLSAEAVYAVSTSSSDTTVLKVLGVNSDGDCETIDVTLNGTTPVQVLNTATDNKWLNINRAFNGGAVAYVGVIYVSTKSGAGTPANTDAIQTKMPIGSEYSSNPMVMCGNNEVLVFTGIDITAAQRDEVSIFISRRLSNGQPWIKAFKLFAFESFLAYRFIVPVVLIEGQKFCFTGSAATATIDMTWQSSYYSLARPTDLTSGIGVIFDPT